MKQSNLAIENNDNWYLSSAYSVFGVILNTLHRLSDLILWVRCFHYTYTYIYTYIYIYIYTHTHTYTHIHTHTYLGKCGHRAGKLFSQNPETHNGGVRIWGTELNWAPEPLHQATCERGASMNEPSLTLHTWKKHLWRHGLCTIVSDSNKHKQQVSRCPKWLHTSLT